MFAGFSAFMLSKMGVYHKKMRLSSLTVSLFLLFFRFSSLLAGRHLLFLLHDHFFDHFATDGTCLSAGQIAIVTVSEV
jgi:hypothetical protein